MEETGCQVGSGSCRIRLQSNRDLELLYGLRILRLCSINQPQQLAKLKGLWGIGQQGFELCRCLGKPSGVILSARRLKLTIQCFGLVCFGQLGLGLVLMVLAGGERHAKQKRTKNHPPRPVHFAHSPPLLLSRERSYAETPRKAAKSGLYGVFSS